MPLKILFNKYPTLKLGFTTQNFIECAVVNVENAKRFIDYANDEGYHWIELRDSNAALAQGDCEEIAGYAHEKVIEIAYANQIAIPDSNFWELFETGLDNAAAFSGPTTMRVLLCGLEFENDTEKKGWSEEEMNDIIERIHKAYESAKKKGLQLIIENGMEALFGDGSTFRGLSDLFKQINPAVGWQFDCANPFSVTRIDHTPMEVKNFLECNIDRLYYMHLKSSQNRQAQPVLMENPLAFDEIFSILSTHNKPYIAIELVAEKTEDQVFHNLAESAVYLTKQGFITLC